MKKKLFVIFAALMLAVTLMPAPASATLFDFSYSGTDVTVSGQLTTEDLGGGKYLITGISGMRNNDAITSFWPGGPDPVTKANVLYNNVIVYPKDGYYLTKTMVSDGFVFEAGGVAYNPYPWDGKYYEYRVPDGGTPGVGIEISNFKVAPVPIPAAVWLLGTGLVGLIGIRRRFVS